MLFGPASPTWRSRGAVAAALLVVLMLVAGLVLASRTSPFDDRDNRTSTGAMRTDVRYEGHESIILNGSTPIADRKLLVSLVTTRWQEGPPEHTLDGFIGKTAPSRPIIVDTGSQPAVRLQLPLEQRAIEDIAGRFAAAPTSELIPGVNIMPGSFSMLAAANADDLVAGRFDADALSGHLYEHPLLYLERGDELRAVLVTTAADVSPEQAEGCRSKYGAQPGQYFWTPRGLMRYERVEGSYVAEDTQYRTWTARPISQSCTWSTLKGNCLHKAAPRPGESQLLGQAAAIAVLPSAMLQLDREKPGGGGARDIRTVPTVTGAGGQVAEYIALGYSSGVNPSSPTSFAELMFRQMRSGGSVFGVDTLVKLPTVEMA